MSFWIFEMVFFFNFNSKIMQSKNQIKFVFLFFLMLFVGSVYSQQVSNTTLENSYLKGEKGFIRHLAMKLRYPKKARENGIIGLSILSFKVDCQNMPYDFVFTTKLKHGIEETIKETIIKTKGNWKSCEKRDKDERINLKIAFSINSLYDPENTDFVINAFGQFTVVEDNILIKKMEKAWKKQKYQKAKPYLEDLIRVSP